MRGNVKKMFGWVPVQFTLVFHLVSRQFDWHPWSAKCLQLWDFKINCWVCWRPLIVSACDTGDLWEGKTTSSAQGTQSLDYYPLAFPFIFLHSNPLLTFTEICQQYIGRKRWELVSWILINSLPLTTFGFVVIIPPGWIALLSSSKHYSLYGGSKNEFLNFP